MRSVHHESDLQAALFASVDLLGRETSLLQR